jgi:hypothetical protein
MHIEFWWEGHRERKKYEKPDVGGWIILKFILEKYDGVVRNGLIWPRIRTSSGILRTW